MQLARDEDSLDVVRLEGEEFVVHAPPWLVLAVLGASWKEPRRTGEFCTFLRSCWYSLKCAGQFFQFVSEGPSRVEAQRVPVFLKEHLGVLYCIIKGSVLLQAGLALFNVSARSISGGQGMERKCMFGER
eukprot:1161062-Pelagomonas_calceolata.AAC.5